MHVDSLSGFIDEKKPRLGVVTGRGACRGGDQGFERTVHESLHSKPLPQIPAFDALPRVTVATTQPTLMENVTVGIELEGPRRPQNPAAIQTDSYDLGCRHPGAQMASQAGRRRLLQLMIDAA